MATYGMALIAWFTISAVENAFTEKIVYSKMSSKVCCNNGRLWWLIIPLTAF